MTRKALIFHGGWDGHEPEACAAIVTTMLRDEGFDVRAQKRHGRIERGGSFRIRPDCAAVYSGYHRTAIA